MLNRKLAWTMAGVALLLGVTWLAWQRPAEPSSPATAASNGAVGSRTSGEVDPEVHEATSPEEQVSDARALALFVEHLETMLEPRDADDPDRMVLRLPEHLQEASEAEKQAYLKDLLHHGEAMVGLVREQLSSWEAEARQKPDLAAELEQRRKETDEAERGLEDLRARLLKEGVLGDAGS